MQKSVKLLTFVFAGAALLQSCASDPIEIPRDELYAREFIKEFGVVQPGNPFNVATRCGVRVVTAKATDVKISAKIGGREYLFADYKGIDGTSDIYFDLPGSVKDIFVRANGKKIPAKVGDTVDLRGNVSRTFGNTGKFDEGRMEFNVTDVEYLSAGAIREFMENVPENGKNITKVISDFYFISDGKPIKFYPIYWNTSSYHALGVYWLDNDGHFSADNMKDVYYTKSGELEWSEDYCDGEDVLTYEYEQCWHNTHNIDGTNGVLNDPSEEGTICPDHNLIKYVVPEGEILKTGEWSKLTAGQVYHIKEKIIPGGTPNAGEWAKAYNGTDANNPDHVLKNDYKNAAYDISKITGIRTKGIEITMPVGKKFGFYLKVSGSNSINPERNKLEPNNYSTSDKIEHIYFSQALRNEIYGTPLGAKDKWNCTDQSSAYGQPWSKENLNGASPDFKYSRASYKIVNYNKKDYTFFAFEDWHYEPDLNDVVFMFDTAMPSHPQIVDKDHPDPEPGDDDLPTYEWIIAAEDLGNTYDFDFNDMVVGINYVAGTKEIKVRPLAAGGIYPVYLMFDKPDGTTMMVNKELHNWFGRSTNQVTNAHENGEEFTADEFTIIWTGEGDFSLAGYAHDSKWDGTDNTTPITNMGGFWLLVDKEGKCNKPGFDFSNAKNEDGGQAVVPNLTKGDVYAPQMICVGTDWCWPREGSHIHEKAYSGFADWIANPDKVLDTWYGANLAAGYTHNTNHTVKRKSVENYQKPTE